jgi:hypothetical protein
VAESVAFGVALLWHGALAVSDALTGINWLIAATPANSDA